MSSDWLINQSKGSDAARSPEGPFWATEEGPLINRLLDRSYIKKSSSFLKPPGLLTRVETPVPPQFGWFSSPRRLYFFFFSGGVENRLLSVTGVCDVVTVFLNLSGFIGLLRCVAFFSFEGELGLTFF